ncbi:hypothetical protein EV384_4643 [Micromonospora kangleipakensis]|uniref:Uncharacterized protein n=1 Tax=Micromonospora kangleipakensis TaxID=1077942 RepID=A0A4V6MGU6_9ACTN|nr:hypothetical protein [Micromonospora kangleipakensis]RZU76046.1 hypothetical protein EV384_4643 [Micromonospora kangleipakensis]
MANRARPKRQSRDAGGRRSIEKRGRGLDELLNGRVIATVGAVALLVIGAAVTPVGEKLVGRIFPAEGTLEAIDMAVENTTGNGTIEPASIDIKVHNKGDARVVTRKIILSVQDQLSVDLCATQGEIPVSGKYDLVIPANTKPGDSIEHRINQQIAPDEADRFLVRLQNPETSAIHGVSLYKIKVAVETNGSPALTEVGHMIVSLPFVPDEKGEPFYWGAAYEEGRMTLDWLEPYQESIERCMRSNSSKLSDFLIQPGERSEDLRVLKTQLR